MPPVRIAVVGAGAFGRNHLRVLHELQQADPTAVELAAVVDADEAARTQAATRYNIPAFASVKELRGHLSPHAACVCVPTLHHAAVATELLYNNGMDVLIEKPFATTLAEADEVLTTALIEQRIVQIGHLERFNPAVTAVYPLLNRPMFFEAHRLSIFTPRSLDVDVVLDLMIHDLDIVLQLAASPVRELRAVGLPVLSGKVDIANVRVEFESGCIANFTASRVSTEQVRKLRFFQPRQYISLDFARQELLSIEVSAAAAAAASMGTAGLAAAGSAQKPGAPGLAEAAQKPGAPSLAEAAQKPGAPGLASETWAPVAQKPASPSTAHPSAGLNLQKFPLERAEPLRLELESFLNSVRTRSIPQVTGEQGRAALALALDINQAISGHAHRAGL